MGMSSGSLCRSSRVLRPGSKKAGVWLNFGELTCNEDWQPEIYISPMRHFLWSLVVILTRWSIATAQIPETLEETVASFRTKAEKGDAVAQFMLGACFLTGFGIPKDDTEAVKWLTKASEQGFADAQFTLSGVYADGIVVQKDMVEAYKWILLAHAQGCRKASEEMTKIERVLTAQQRVEGQRRAREFKPVKAK